MSLWGATDADESKPKNLTTAEKKEVFANASGWVQGSYYEQRAYMQGGNTRTSSYNSSGLQLPTDAARSGGEMTIWDPNYAESGGGVIMMWQGIASNSATSFNGTLAAGTRACILDTDSAMTTARITCEQAVSRLKWTVYGVGEQI